MFVHVDFGVAFQLFCIVQGFTAAAFLLLEKGTNRASNRWLGLLVLGLTLQVVDYFLSRSGVYFRNRWLYFTPLFFSWSFGPLLLNYVRATGGLRPLRWPHFVPVAGQLSFYLVVALQSFDTKTWFWLTVHKPFTRYLEHYVAILALLVYLRLALQLVPPAGWLRRSLLALGGFCLAAALDPIINSYYLPVGAPKFYLTSLVLPGLAYGVALLSVRRSRGAYEAPATPAAAHPPLRAAGAPTASSSVPNPEQLQRLVAALEEDQLYRNPDLTLDGLAQHLGLTANAVSQLLNAGLGQSFYDLVNGYRLEKVKHRLLSPDIKQLTILALALEAGFNSKTTFNRVFKEKTGLTPKAYQKKYQPTHWNDSGPVPD